MHKARKKVTIQMRNQSFYGKYLVLVIKVLTEFKRAYGCLQIHKSPAVLLFRDFWQVRYVMLSRRSFH